MAVFFIISTIVGLVILKLLYNLFFQEKDVMLNCPREGWKVTWTESEPSDDVAIKPFEIQVPDDMLQDLKKRLNDTRLVEPVEDANFDYGFNTTYLQSVLNYWKTDYDWRKQETELNKFKHFKTRIEGLDIHFVHAKPVLPEGSKLRVLPLLIVHGWPGSFYEFYKLIPLLTTPMPDHDFVFEVIAPSIPGYGFSSSPSKKGFDCEAAARVFMKLMDRLELIEDKFYVQGGDWSSQIVTIMGKFYPHKVAGVHLNMFSSLRMHNFCDSLKILVNAYFPSLIPSAEYKAFFPLKSKLYFLLQESGYFHMNATKPDTVGCALSDSPAGLAAYILEKFSTWTDQDGLKKNDGDLTSKFTLDELLTNVMIYWVNRNITSSLRFYKENIAGDIRRLNYFALPVPCGFALFPNELLAAPRWLMSLSVKKLVSYNVMAKGGHFAAMEEPGLLAEDIWKFVGLVQKKEY